MEVQALRRTSAGRISQFQRSEILSLRELRTYQIGQVLKASPAVHTYVLKNSRIGELYFHFICAGNVSVTLLNGTWLCSSCLELVRYGTYTV